MSCLNLLLQYKMAEKTLMNLKAQMNKQKQHPEKAGSISQI